MPLHLTLHPNSQTTVKLWKITESYNELFQGVTLQPKHLERVLEMKSELHQRGFLSIRHLLKAFGYSDSDLYYDENGKPHLRDGKYISITHSFIFSGVIISDVPIGIDIEKQREKIKVIAHKFIAYEANYLIEEKEYINKLTVIWGAKEALYKLFATPGLSFKNHILVIPFMLHDEETIAWIDYENKKYRYKIYFFEFEGFTCAYAIS
ncbi:4'-phosphopantetheinyl transferase superfamily protein [Flavobacteriaceae bacterium AU392]|nr:4-phosphopantetheinyl transferase family protein [Flavobacteriaceae bacterium]RKM85050.1 4'-phosphopantetheinyl transferase superfamily protein [Flavobacteriaceae bacterium AU392]